MHPTDGDDPKLTTNSSPWASEVESMKFNKKQKRQTETPDISTRRIVKGKRRIRSFVGNVKSNNDYANENTASKTPSTSALTPRKINTKVSLNPSPIITMEESNISGINALNSAQETTLGKNRKLSDTKRDPSLNNKNNTLQGTTFTKHIDSPISEIKNLTIKKRTRRNTYDLQDTVNDLEILVKESPKNIDGNEENIREKKKKKTKIPEPNLLKNNSELQDGEISKSSPLIIANNETEMLQINMKIKVNKRSTTKTNQNGNNINDDLNTRKKSPVSKNEISLKNSPQLDDGLLNESIPSCFVNESCVMDKKGGSRKCKNESDVLKVQDNSKNKRVTCELEDTIKTPKYQKNAYKHQELVNNIDVPINNSVENDMESANKNCTKNSETKVNPITPRKRWKTRETDSIADLETLSNSGKYQKRRTFKMDSPMKIITDETSQKRNTFEIKPNMHNKNSQIEIDSNEIKSVTEKPQKQSTVETGFKSQKRSTFEIKPDINKSQKRSTFEIDPKDSLTSGMKRNSKEFDLDDAVSNECSFKKRRTSEMKPEVSLTKRVRRRGIYRSEKVSTSSDEELKTDSVSGDTSSYGVFQLLSPWKDQTSINKEIDSQKIFEKPKFLTPLALEKKTNTKTSSQVKKSANKMPNYSLIHKKVFDRMESLEDHLERKKARANALLSGSKVKIGITPNTKTSTPNSKKQLFLNKPQENTPNKFINSGKKVSPMKNKDRVRTPIKMMRKDKTPVKCKSEKENKSPTKCKSSTKTQGQPTPKTFMKTKIFEITQWLASQEGKSPSKTQFGNSAGRKNVSVKFRTPPMTPINYSTIKNRVQTPIAFKTNIIKPQKKITPSKSNIPVLVKPLIPVPSGITRFGFRMNQESDLKAQALKAVATKTRTKTNTVEERRNYIKGVRSNRRFDLLMNMRKQKQ